MSRGPASRGGEEERAKRVVSDNQESAKSAASVYRTGYGPKGGKHSDVKGKAKAPGSGPING